MSNLFYIEKAYKMNTTTNKQDETLEEVSIRIFPPDLSNIDEEPFEVDFNKSDRDIFIQGANWQKEQDKVIIDKLKSSLVKIVNWHKAHEPLSFIDENDLKEAEQLLNSLK